MLHKLLVVVAFVAITFLLYFMFLKNNEGALSFTQDWNQKKAVEALAISDVVMMKDVGEAYMDHFGLTDRDFEMMRDAGVNVIEGNFDICADPDDVSEFLDRAHEHNLRVVLNAGSGEAEWGYACDSEPYPVDQNPVWDRDAVKDWIYMWRDHPALFGWDTSNEAGSVFPNANGKNYLTLSQLQQAYHDVKRFDPNHPVMIRMNGWYFYDFKDDFFRRGNPFGEDVADVVMVNAYTNVDEYFDDFVTTVSTRSVSSIRSIDPDAKFIFALGVWREPPLWRLPTQPHLVNDISSLEDLDTPAGIGFFKYGARGSEWYLPKDAPELWDSIQDKTK